MFKAMIVVGNKEYNLGTFETRAEAEEVEKSARELYLGEYDDSEG